MQMQEEVRQHHHNSIAAIQRHWVTKDAFPDLRVANRVAERHGVLDAFDLKTVVIHVWCNVGCGNQVDPPARTLRIDQRTHDQTGT
jgi:hypothetical protein